MPADRLHDVSHQRQGHAYPGSKGQTRAGVHPSRKSCAPVHPACRSCDGEFERRPHFYRA
jgi:hypothetical protein